MSRCCRLKGGAGDVAAGQRASGAAAGAEARARRAGPGAGVLRSGPVWVCVTAADDDPAHPRCAVVAPALIPRKPGDRVKTNRRDARKLVELGRAGLLTPVHPPTPAQEAVRDLCRARDDAREDLQRARHRLGKLLLGRGLHYGGRNWTRPHRQWMESLAWPHAADQIVVEDFCWRSITPRPGSARSISRSRRSPRPSPIARQWAGCAVFAVSTP